MAIGDSNNNQTNTGGQSPRRRPERPTDAPNLADEFLKSDKNSKILLDALKKLKNESKNITTNIKELATKGLPQSSKAAKLLNASFEKIYKRQNQELKKGFIDKKQFENAKKAVDDIYAGFSKNISELASNIDDLGKSTYKALDFSDLNDKLKTSNQSIIKERRRLNELENIKNELSKDGTKNANKSLDYLKKSGNYTKEELDLLASSNDEFEHILRSSRARIKQQEASNDQIAAGINVLKAESKQLEVINEKLKQKGLTLEGIASDVKKPFDSFFSYLESLPGGSMLSKVLGLNKIKDDIETKIKQQLIESFKAGKGTGSSMLSALSSGFGELFKNIGAISGVLGIGLLITGIVAATKALFGLDKKVTQLAKDFDISKESAHELNKTAINISGSMASIGVRAEDVVASIKAISESTGLAATAISEDLVESVTLISKAFGLTAEESMQLNGVAITLGTTLDNLAAQTAKMGKGFMSQRDVLKAIAKVSKSVAITFRGNTQELAKQAIKAKLLGTTLDKIAGIGESMLDIESSITAENEARILTGKQLNLNAARYYALTGQTGKLMDEIVNNVGTFSDYQKMLPLQQASLAKAFGMTRDELTEMLVKQNELSTAGVSYERAQRLMAMNAADLNKELAKASGKEKDYIQKIAEEKRQTEVAEKFQIALTNLASKLQTYLEPLLTYITAVLDKLFPKLNSLFGFDTDKTSALNDTMASSTSAVTKTTERTKQLEGVFGKVDDTVNSIVDAVKTFKKIVKDISPIIKLIAENAGLILKSFIGYKVLKGLTSTFSLMSSTFKNIAMASTQSKVGSYGPMSYGGLPGIPGMGEHYGYSTMMPGAEGSGGIGGTYTSRRYRANTRRGRNVLGRDRSRGQRGRRLRTGRRIDVPDMPYGLDELAELGFIIAPMAYDMFSSNDAPAPEEPGTVAYKSGALYTGKGGVDKDGGFLAVLHPGEAVIPKDVNEKYHPAIKSIFHEKISPDVANSMVSDAAKNHSYKTGATQVNPAGKSMSFPIIAGGVRQAKQEAAQQAAEQTLSEPEGLFSAFKTTKKIKKGVKAAKESIELYKQSGSSLGLLGKLSNSVGSGFGKIFGKVGSRFGPGLDYLKKIFKLDTITKYLKKAAESKVGKFVGKWLAPLINIIGFGLDSKKLLNDYGGDNFDTSGIYAGDSKLSPAEGANRLSKETRTLFLERLGGIGGAFLGGWAGKIGGAALATAVGVPPAAPTLAWLLGFAGSWVGDWIGRILGKGVSSVIEYASPETADMIGKYILRLINNLGFVDKTVTDPDQLKKLKSYLTEEKLANEPVKKSAIVDKLEKEGKLKPGKIPPGLEKILPNTKKSDLIAKLENASSKTTNKSNTNNLGINTKDPAVQKVFEKTLKEYSDNDWNTFMQEEIISGKSLKSAAEKEKIAKEVLKANPQLALNTANNLPKYFMGAALLGQMISGSSAHWMFAEPINSLIPKGLKKQLIRDFYPELTDSQQQSDSQKRLTEYFSQAVTIPDIINATPKKFDSKDENARKIAEQFIAKTIIDSEKLSSLSGTDSSSITRSLSRQRLDELATLDNDTIQKYIDKLGTFKQDFISKEVGFVDGIIDPDMVDSLINDRIYDAKLRLDTNAEKNKILSAINSEDMLPLLNQPFTDLRRNAILERVFSEIDLDKVNKFKSLVLGIDRQSLSAVQERAMSYYANLVDYAGAFGSDMTAVSDIPNAVQVPGPVRSSLPKRSYNTAAYFTPDFGTNRPQAQVPMRVEDALIRPGMQPIKFRADDLILSYKDGTTVAGTNLLGEKNTGAIASTPTTSEVNLTYDTDSQTSSTPAAINNNADMKRVVELLTQLIGKVDQPVVLKIGNKAILEMNKQTSVQKSYTAQFGNTYGA